MHLGIGPMSEATVLAVIELATSLKQPLMLIASRRQIECADFGGGYVNDWSTETFAQFVRLHDPEGYVVLCRDHGGPWQGNYELSQKMNLKEAMDTCKHSYEEDIRAGFEILHIDPSVGFGFCPTHEQTIEWLKELLVFCNNKANEFGKELYYEIGKEEQQIGVEKDEHAFSQFLNEIIDFTEKYNVPKPLFVVGQTGTKVLERYNIGSLERFASSSELLSTEAQISKIVKTCNHYGIHLKAHNGDYLSNGSIARLAQLGVHAMNIAPECGVGETLQLVEICQKFGLHDELDEFLGLAYKSNKWEKWMMSNSEVDDQKRAIIAGHYVFSTPQFKGLKNKIENELKSHSVDLSRHLVENNKKIIHRYLCHSKLKQDLSCLSTEEFQKSLHGI